MRGDGGGGVLLVEDDAMVRAALALELEAEGFAVLQAPDAAAALRAMRGARRGAAPVALLVVDLDLGPGAPDGRALAAAARLRRPGLPVVFITGHAGPAPGDAAAAAAAAGDAARPGPRERLLRKPFAPEDLHAAVRALLPPPGDAA